MIEFRICDNYPVLITPKAHPVEKTLEIGCDGEDITLVKLYCCENGDVVQSPFLSGKAVFDSLFIREGLTYLPELVSAEGKRLSCNTFKAFSCDSKLFLCPISRATLQEISDMWCVIAACFSMAERCEKLARQTCNALERLEKGYRTE